MELQINSTVVLLIYLRYLFAFNNSNSTKKQKETRVIKALNSQKMSFQHTTYKRSHFVDQRQIFKHSQMVIYIIIQI